MSSGEAKGNAGNQTAEPCQEKKPLISRPRKHVVVRGPTEAEVQAARLLELGIDFSALERELPRTR